MLYRYGERLPAVGRSYLATVAEGSLAERFAGVNIAGIGGVELPIP